MEWASSGMRHYGDTGSGCRTAYGPNGCPTVHSFSMVGGLKVGWDGRISNPQAVTALL